MEKHTEERTKEVPLKGISYECEIDGLFAKIVCCQNFKVEGDKPIEAIYVFPLPDEASVKDFEMQIGERKVKGKLKEREVARQEYEEARDAGHHAAMVEQERPNIFTMNVGGIEPGEKINVLIEYIQRVPWQAGGGRFKIPLVVAPRFIPGKPTGKSGDGWAEDTDKVPDASKITPVVSKGGVPYSAQISIKLNTGFPCKIESPSHKTLVENISLKTTESHTITVDSLATDRDFILTYQSSSPVPEVTLHKGQFKGENFALAQIFPSGTALTEPSDIILVLDKSGSMMGPKIAGLKIVAKKVVESLQNQNLGHRIGIIAYANSPNILSPVQDISDDTEKVIENIEAGGGTETGMALDKAMELLKARKEEKRSQYILLVSDGQTETRPTVGFEDVTIITAGIDTAVNDTFLKRVARKTGGVSQWIYPGEDYTAVSNRLTGMLSGPILRNIEVMTENVETVGGPEHVFAGLPAFFALRAKDQIDVVRIEGDDISTGETRVWKLEVDEAETCDFSHVIWAREKIRQTVEVDEQVKISLKYGVICRGTAFVAISEKKIPGQKPERVEIPVELPSTWEYDAVFGESSQVAQLASGAGRKVMRLRSFYAEEVAPKRSSREVRSLRAPRTRRAQRKASATTSSPIRFSLSDPTELVIVILMKLNKNENVDREWNSLKNRLTLQVVSNWTEDKKARTLYFLKRIEKYGYAVDKEIIQALDKGKSIWHSLIKRELDGVLIEKPKNFPSGAEGDYLKWKSGVGSRPAQEPWKSIP